MCTKWPSTLGASLPRSATEPTMISRINSPSNSASTETQTHAMSALVVNLIRQDAMVLKEAHDDTAVFR